MTDATLKRVERDTAIACAAFSFAALAIWPHRPRVALGVLGGGGLVGLSYWTIRGAVDGIGRGFQAGVSDEVPRGVRGVARRALVKFVTRHAILAAAAYVMMARLHLDAIGMLVGVSAVGVAAAAEAVRSVAAAGHRKF